MSIKETVESFIKFRTSIGRKDQSTTYSLRLFAKFIGETTELTSITESDSNAFLYRKGNVITRYWHSQHCILKKLLPQFGIKLRLVACEDRYASSLPMPSDMGCI